MTEPGPARAPRRPLWTIVLVLAAAALALWGASRLTWATRMRDLAGARPSVQDVPGATVAPALVPLAVLALAAIAAVVATGGWPRRLVGVVAFLAGIAAFVAVLDDVRGPWLGRSIALLGGLLLLAAGAALVALAGRLPRLGAAYSAPGRGSRPVDEDTRLWQALSEGDDPTLGR